jgi:phosphoribosylformylglycinamidine cyclo-ligase
LSKKKGLSYKDAGVDIDMSDSFKNKIATDVRSTFSKGVMSDIGLFGGLFDLKKTGMRDPVLVSSIDGVGTKLQVAVMTGKHSTVGRDLVSHCINDIGVQGAVPLFFLDYIGASNLEPKIYRDIIKGLAFECRKSRCALIGGETAQMPGMYPKGEYDLVGVVIGAVERSRIIDGSKVKKGDTLIGIASNGLHTNGYSLARKILFDRCGLGVGDHVEEIRSKVGPALLKPHVNYGDAIQKLIRRFNIKALAHITGGGLPGNLNRVLPEGTAAEVIDGSWPVPRLFQFMEREGAVARREMFRTFNMGVGMVAIVSQRSAPAVIAFLRAMRLKSWNIGSVTKGDREIIIS